MARPITVPKRPLPPMRILEGAAGLLEIANRLKEFLDTQNTDKINVNIRRSEIVALEYAARLTAHTVDDLVWVMEKQQMEMESLRVLLKVLQRNG